MKAELFPVLTILLLSSAPAFGGQDVATKLVTIETPTHAGSMDFNADGSQLVLEAYGFDGTAVYDLKRRQIVHHLPISTITLGSGELVHYSPDGKLLAICGFSKPLQRDFMGVYDAATWEVVHEIVDESKEGDRGCNGIAFTPDGKKLIRLAVIPIWRQRETPGNNILIYDTSNWQVIKRFRTQALVSHPSEPERLEDYVVTPNTLLIDPSDPTISFDTEIPNLNTVYAVSPDSRYLAVAGLAMGGKLFLNRHSPTEPEKLSIMIIDIEDYKLARVIGAGSDSLDWSPDGVHLASAGRSATDSISIFDVRSGEKIAAEPSKDGWELVRYTPDGRYLIACVGKRVEIWDGQHQQLLQTIPAYPGNIAVSPDSRYLALSGDKLNILDATALLSLFAHPNGVPGKAIIYRLK
jgi:WD40 repeat protein